MQELTLEQFLESFYDPAWDEERQSLPEHVRAGQLFQVGFNFHLCHATCKLIHLQLCLIVSCVFIWAAAQKQAVLNVFPCNQNMFQRLPTLKVALHASPKLQVQVPIASFEAVE